MKPERDGRKKCIDNSVKEGYMLIKIFHIYVNMTHLYTWKINKISLLHIEIEIGLMTYFRLSVEKYILEGTSPRKKEFNIS